MAKYCSYCGSEIKENYSFCSTCGANINGEVKKTVNPTNGNSRSRIVAGLLGIFFGGIGIHNFYLGFTNRAIIQIVVSIFTCGIGSIWGFVEGIMILCGSINVDADGVPLVD